MVNPDTYITSHNTTHNNSPMTRKTNEEKIYDFILIQNRDLTTTEISKGTGIDLKNITRYLKALEEQNKITREVKQEGKKRFVYVILINKSTTRSEQITSGCRNITTHKIDEEKKTISKTLLETLKKENNKTKDTGSGTTHITQDTMSRTQFTIPDFNELIQFCKEHYKNESGEVIDIELEQFLKHTLPRLEHKREFGFERGGGGWGGSAKCTLIVINKLLKAKKEGV